MTTEQSRQIVNDVLAVVGWRMRETDYAVVVMMTAGGLECLPTVLIEAAAEYAWDHLLGEPKRPTPKMIVSEYRKRRNTQDPNFT